MPRLLKSHNMRKVYGATITAATLACLQPTIAIATPPKDVPAAQQQQAMQETAKTFSDKELKQFAKAQKSLQLIQMEHQSALSGVQDEAKAQQIQKAFMQKAAEAVKSSGLDLQRFTEISQVASQDQNLQKRLMKIMK